MIYHGGHVRWKGHASLMTHSFLILGRQLTANNCNAVHASLSCNMYGPQKAANKGLYAYRFSLSFALAWFCQRLTKAYSPVFELLGYASRSSCAGHLEET